MTWKTQSWKLIFVASFISAVNLYVLLVDRNALQDVSKLRQLSTFEYLLAGVLVGFGTKLGNGCTSGHGICGLARFSRRSFAAVATFMAFGMATASLVSTAVVRTLSMNLDIEFSQRRIKNTKDDLFFGVVVGAVVALWVAGSMPSTKAVGATLSGALFAVGLVVSQMVLPSKVLGFLDLTGISSGNYDPSLMFVMGGGLLISILGYQYKRHKCDCKPLMTDAYAIPTNTVIDMPLLLGACSFGAGWGLAGFCPGPALAQAAVGNSPILFLWMPAFLGGSYIGSKVKEVWSTTCSIRAEK